MSDLDTLNGNTAGAYLVLDPNYKIVDVSEQYLHATLTTRDKLIGQNLFDAFPDNPELPIADGVKNLSQSLQRAIETKEPDEMDIQRYDIRRPEELGGGFEVRFWKPVNFPICDDEGNLTHIVHRVEDVTQATLLKLSTTTRIDQWAKRIVIGFVILTIGMSFAVWKVDSEGRKTDGLAVELKESAREACERNNVVRGNQAHGLQAQIDSTQATLDSEMGLGSLEPFREQIVAQHEQRKINLRELEVSAKDYPDPDDPYQIDCVKAHP